MIVFLSDNGWMQGEHRITGDKFLPYEESLRIPLILRGPGVPEGPDDRHPGLQRRPRPHPRRPGRRQGRAQDGRALAAAGLARPRAAARPRASRSRRPSPSSPSPFPVNRWDRPYKGVRTYRYTYVVWTETGEEELYDRTADPYQLTNVASDPAFASVKAELAAKLTQLENCKGKACNEVAP